MFTGILRLVPPRPPKPLDMGIERGGRPVSDVLHSRGGSVTIPALHLQQGFYTPVSEHGYIALDARRTLELIAFYPIDFLHRIHGCARLARQQFNFRFSRGG